MYLDLADVSSLWVETINYIQIYSTWKEETVLKIQDTQWKAAEWRAFQNYGCHAHGNSSLYRECSTLYLFYTSLHNLFFKQSLVLASLTRIRLLSGHTRTKYNQHLQAASS